MMGMLWARGAYNVITPPVCPLAPFDPSTLGLSLWLRGDSCPGAGIDWDSENSAGTSGNIHTSFHIGGGPQSVSKPLAVSPCGLATAQFLTTPNTILKITDDPSNPVAPATIVYCGKFIASADPGFGAFYVGGMINDFANGWKVQFDSTGHAQVAALTGAGAQTATTSNAVASGDWFVVVVEFTAGGVTVKLNHGTPASTANAWAPGTRGTMYLGFDPIFGAQLDAQLGELFISNTALSAGDITNLEDHCEWYIGTTV